MPVLGEIKRGYEIGKWVGGKYIWHACIGCGRERWVMLHNLRKEAKPRSLSCVSCNGWGKGLRPPQPTGERAYNWRGGCIKDNRGYLHIKLVKDDFFFPMADKNRYVPEHRLVVAKALNRCLLPWEIVHHKEGYAKADNRYPETLELLPSSFIHNVITHSTNNLKKEIKKLQIENSKLKCYIKKLGGNLNDR